MKCKYCQAELEDDATVCPACGKEVEQPAAEQETPVEPAQEAPAEAAQEAPAGEPEAPAIPVNQDEEEEDLLYQEPPREPEEKRKPGSSAGKIAIAVVVVVALLAVLIAVVTAAARKGGEPQPTVPGDVPAVPTAAPTVPADGNPDDATCKGSYTVSDEEAAAAADTVVATMGDRQLTNGQLQVYYWMQVYEFLNQYGNYAPYMGLDLQIPLDMQTCAMSEDQPMTWQQFFLMSAFESWHRYQALALEGEANGYLENETYRQLMEVMADDVETRAKASGFESGDAMVKDTVGQGADLEDYLAYSRIYYLGYVFFNDRFDSFTPSDEEIAAYFAEHEKEYADQGVNKDDYVVDVRHILINPEGGTKDEQGNVTYSEAEWEAARVRSQEILDQWLAGPGTEEDFARLAGEHSADPGSAQNGGLYTRVQPGDMVAPFNEWIFDKERVPGDSGLVKTDFGYHVMYFSARNDVWQLRAKQDIVNARSNELVEDAIARTPAEFHYEQVSIGNVDLLG